MFQLNFCECNTLKCKAHLTEATGAPVTTRQHKTHACVQVWPSLCTVWNQQLLFLLNQLNISSWVTKPTADELVYIIIYIQHKVIFFSASSHSKYYKCFLNNSTANNPILPISILILRMLQRMSDTKFQEFLKNQRNCAKFNARENPNTIIGFSMDRWRDFVTLTKSTILIH